MAGGQPSAAGRDSPIARGGRLNPFKPPLRSVRFWALLAAVWTVPAIVGSVVYYVRQLQEGEPISWGHSISFIYPFWILWALATPLVLRLGGRFPLEGRRVWRNALVHAGLGLSFSLLHLFVALLIIRRVQAPQLPFVESYRYFIGSYLEFEFLLYWAILGAGYLLDYHGRYRAGALHTAQLETQLAQAHLQALKVQLQPHFLFNTLHAISSLMDEDVEQARRMLVRLGDLLRLTLEMQGVHEVTLEQELECTDLYLDIERVRFPDNLQVELLVEPGTLDALVPNLILQPLVENAVRFGVAPRENGGRITITAKREEDVLHLQVKDDGPGQRTVESGKGVGLTNVRTRLVQLYGWRQEVRASRSEAGGFAVELKLPFHTAPLAAVVG